MSETMKAAVPAGVTRRNILAAPLLAAMAGAYAEGARAAVPDETPVMALFREWQAAKADEDAVFAATDDEDEKDRAQMARYGVEDRLMQEPCRNARDWALKLCAWCNFGEATCPNMTEDPQLWAEARALVG